MPDSKSVPELRTFRRDDGKPIAKCSHCDKEFTTEEPVKSESDLALKVATAFQKHMFEKHRDKV